MSGFALFDRWFKKRNTAVASDTLDAAEVRQVQQEQRELADEVERVTRRFDKLLQDLAYQARSLSTASEGQREKLREAQDRLRMALRRMETTMKQTQELSRELREWERRAESPSADFSSLPADRPQVRSEILRSELAVRGVSRELPEKLLSSLLQSQSRLTNMSSEAREMSPNASIETNDPYELSEQIEELVSHVPEVGEDQVATGDEESSIGYEVDATQLIAAIREATREAERWHAIPSTEHDDDALVQVRHVRELHALLKRLDREAEVQRDRLALAISAREMHALE